MTTHTIATLKTPAAHRGVVLVIALVIMLAMSLLAAAAVDSLNLQSQLARGDVQQQSLRQLSLNEIQGQVEALRDPALRRRIAAAGTRVAATTAGVSGSHRGIVLSARDLTVTAEPAHYSHSGSIAQLADKGGLLGGYSLNGFVVHRYEIHIVSQLNGTGLQSDQTQGVAWAEPDPG